MFKRALLLCFAVLPLSLSSLPVHAQSPSFPTKPITLIVPFSPGGALDNVARAFAETMKEHIGKPVVVENRPGGNYMVGTRALLGNAADGYTLMLTTNGMMSITPVLYANTSFDPLKDFTHVGLVSSYPYVLVSGKGRFPNLETAIKQAKAKPESVSMAYTGHVTSLSVDLLGSLIDSKMLKVPYKGDADAVSDLASERVDLGMFGPSVALSLVKGGKLDALAVTTSTRLSTLEDVPTVNEASLEGFNIVVWTGLIAPAGVPEDVVAALQDALNKSLHDEKFQKHLSRTGDTILPGSTEDFRKRINDDQNLWRKVMSDAEIEPIES